MKSEISISDFKTHCLELVSKMEIDKKNIIITKRNKAVAKLIPYQKEKKTPLFGSMKDKATIKKDIVKSLNEKWSIEND